MRQHLSAYSLYVACAAMPFSISICHAALIVFLSAWVTEGDWKRKWETLKADYIQLILMSTMLTLLVGVTYSHDTNAAWFVLEKKCFFFLVPIALATSASNVPTAFRKQIAMLFCVSCAAALVFCYVNAYQQSELFKQGQIGAASINYLSSSEYWNSNGLEKTWLFFSYVGLSGALHIHPTYLAMYCAFCCFVLVQYSFEAQLTTLKRILGISALIFFSISIVFLSAKIILVVLSLYYVGMLLWLIFSKQKDFTRACTILVVLLLVTAGVLINPITRYRQIEEVAANTIDVTQNKHYTNSTGMRLSLWWLSAHAYLNSNLVFGEGTGDVDSAVRNMSQHYNITNVLDNYDPHNQYLYSALANGLIGLLLLILYFGLMLAKAFQNRDLIFSSFVILFMAVCVTESAMELQKGIIFFCFFSSCMLYAKRESGNVEPTTILASA